MSKKSLRQLVVPDGVMRLPASAVREYLNNPPAKPNKYRALRTERHGLSFASEREADRYDDLLLMVRAGDIRDLEVQPRYPLVVNGVKVCTYVGDFRWIDKSGNVVLSDAKGYHTQAYVIKKKLVRALYGLEIREL